MMTQKSQNHLELEIKCIKEFGDKFSVSLTQMLMFEGALIWSLVQFGKWDDLLLKSLPSIAILSQILFTIIYRFNLMNFSDLKKLLDEASEDMVGQGRFNLFLNVLSAFSVGYFFESRIIQVLLISYFVFLISIPVFGSMWTSFLNRALNKVNVEDTSFSRFSVNYLGLLVDCSFFSISFFEIQRQVLSGKQLSSSILLFAIVFVFKLFMVSKECHNEIGIRYKELMKREVPLGFFSNINPYLVNTQPEVVQLNALDKGTHKAGFKDHNL